MDLLVKDQLLVSKQLKALELTYHQLAEERKTLKLLDDRLTKLEQLWVQFEGNDNTIRDSYGDRLDHLYFTENFYDQTANLYGQLKKEFQKKKEELLRRANPDSEPPIFPTEQPIPPEEPQLVPIEPPMPRTNGINKNRNITSEVEKEEQVKMRIRRCQRNTSSLKRLISNIVVDGQSTQYYKQNLQIIQRKWDEIHQDDIEISTSIVNPEALGHFSEDIDDLEMEFNRLIIQLREQLDKIPQAQNDNDLKYNAIHKLPSITLPKFNGDYSKWVQFRDLFNQLIHKQPLQNVEKMWYLKANLVDEPEKLIRHLLVSEKNYTTAWTILNERYNKERLLVSTILEKLISQPNVVAGSAKSLKQMYDVTKECILSLENMEISVSGVWDPIVLHQLYKKLDKDTHTYYEQSLKSPRQLQSLEEFLNFIELRFQSLESLGSKPQIIRVNYKPSHKVMTLHTTVNKFKCIICAMGHHLFSCPKFIKMSPHEREIQARKNNLCLNCLRSGHLLKSCQAGGCKKCGQKHSSWLHNEKVWKPNNAEPQLSQQKQEETIGKADVHLGSTEKVPDNYVFLGTANATVIGTDKQKDCRILLDPGSQLNFISERLQRQLKLDTKYRKIEVKGIGDTQFVPTTGKVNVTIKSKNKEFDINIEAQVMKEITRELPHKFVDVQSWNIPNNIKLADPQFNEPRQIDILLGAETYAEVFQCKRLQLRPELSILYDTIFGWVVLGKMKPEVASSFSCITNNQLNEDLIKFWKLEEIPENNEKLLTRADQKCEEFFKSTTYRSEEGKFVVNLPILGSPKVLGESKSIALRRFLNLEKKLSSNIQLKDQYSEFMRDYLELGHMSEIKAEEIPETHYFLPHHCVIKEDSSTTKLRVVFDAPCKTSSNLSLNDIMMKGPKVQDDLFEILLRFRTYKYVITADIKQMYRQIEIAEEDRDLQLIMWRFNPSDVLRYYQLKTVTYGTKAAPYLATRCLKLLAEEERVNYPKAVKAMKDFYIDDLITGSNTLVEIIELKRQLLALMKSACLNLHKWASNDNRIIADISEEKRELIKEFQDGDINYIKTLGLAWQPLKDKFTFVTTWPTIEEKITKRKIVSEISRLFDPLGLINPVVVVAKILIQKLWKMKIDWDEDLNEELTNDWINYRQDLETLKRIEVPRYILNENIASRIELHAFGDASEKAYGAAIYMRSINIKGGISCELLCSKSRVAPIKVLTISKLELCAALLAVKLLTKVKNSIAVNIDECYFWSDSKNVLSWITGDPASYKRYVANRLTALHDKSTPEQWNYVESKKNPADMLSRGVTPEYIKNLELWFQGPCFLKKKEAEWPSRTTDTEGYENEEKRSSFIIRKMKEQQASNHPLHTIDHRNSFLFLRRVTAYVLRGTKLFKSKSFNKNEDNRIEMLTVEELNRATIEIVKEIQKNYFADELKQLKKGTQVPKYSRLSSLSPIIDSNGMIRVGGRLEKANISFNAKHPMILPGNDFVSRLLMQHLHEKNLHIGPLALLAISRQDYWVLNGKDLAKTIVRNCVHCAKAKPQLFQQMMGNLPAERVLPTRPFSNTGVDFCGPIWTHYHLRGKRPTKSYIAVFCCFSTKAIHMEVVSDLTTEAFLGALKRFMARRGYCKNLFCDNATDFIGAHNKLAELRALLETSEVQEKIIDQCANKSVQFKFIPPRSPHFGGLWEAAVKSAKKLLQHSLVSASLTFEELSTVVAEAEAVLNSRPLTPLSNHPEDLSALTPGHFLIGEPLTTRPELSLPNNKLAMLSRWKLVSAMRTDFWKRWTKEYLTELQKRYKWKKAVRDIKIGMLVILKDDNSPPLKWQMGRIQEVTRGNDGLIRVATVKTVNGLFKRAIHNIAPLPIETEDETDEEFLQGEKRKQSEEGPRKKTKTQPFSAGIFFIITMIFLPLVILSEPVSLPYKITTLNHNAGIFVNQLATGHMIETEWKIIVYYNMSNYWKTYSLLNQGIDKMKHLAKLTVDRHFISMVVNEYEHQMHEIQETNQLLFTNNSYINRRKRGLINAVGNIANVLFGVLDDNYAKQIEDTIQTVHQDQDQIFKLMKEQTSIIEATNNLIKKSHEQFLTNFKKLQIEVNEIAIKFKDVYEKMQITQSLMFFSQYVLLTINEFRRMQEKLVDIITDLHHGKASPFILSPKQLSDHLESLKQQLNGNLMLPKLSEIYGLMSVKSKINANFAIFIFSMPLISSTEYDLVQLIPFPVKLNNVYMKIETTVEYIMINRHRDITYTLSKPEFEACTKIENEQFICKRNRPYFTEAAQDLQCEFTLMKQRKISSSCKMTVFTPRRIWIQLYQLNHWLFSLPEPKGYNLVCNGLTYSIKLNNSGILDLYDDCMLKEEEVTIQSYKTKKLEFTMMNQPIVELPNDVNFTILNISLSQLFNQSQEELSSFETDYQQVKKQLALLKSNNDDTTLHHHIHHYVISYVSLALALILFAVVILLKTAISRKRLHVSPNASIQTPTIQFTKGEFQLDV